MKKLSVFLVSAVMLTALFAGNEFEKRMETSFNEIASHAVPLFVVDAISNEPVSNALVSVEGLGSVYTGKNGKAFIKAPKDGIYTIRIEKNGYIAYRSRFEIQAGTVFRNDNVFAISKSMPLQYLRIVLEWSDTPQDLDIHLLKNSDTHISYRNMRSSKDRKIKLDRDDRDAYGPETITVKKVDPKSVYQVYVHNYSKRKNALSHTFNRSCATVSVYWRNQLAAQYQVPKEAGAFWRVFNIERAEIRPVNRVYEK